MKVIRRSDNACLILSSAQMLWPDAKDPNNTLVRYDSGLMFKIFDVNVLSIFENDNITVIGATWEQVSSGWRESGR